MSAESQMRVKMFTTQPGITLSATRMRREKIRLRKSRFNKPSTNVR